MSEQGNNAEWKPVLSFGIDDGELDGMTPQDIFTRGFEMGRTYGACENFGEGDKQRFMIHSDNEQRNQKAADKLGCWLKKLWVNDDWLDVMIGKG